MEPHRSIFVLDSDDQFRYTLSSCFENAGFKVLESKFPKDLFEVLTANKIDLVTIGTLSGGERSLDTLRSLRQIYDDGIILINESSDLIDLVLALEMGADDCMSKPLKLREMLARSKSIIRRTNPPISKPEQRCQYSFENWTLTPTLRTLKNSRGELCNLTEAEFGVLEVLLRKARIVLSRAQILDALTQESRFFNERSIDNHVAQLRKKVTCSESKSLIKTVRGKGYMLDVRVDHVGACRL
ncbi:MAG: winged helix-turn-helix domain-containing protein [Granulosicoccus sp.]